MHLPRSVRVLITAGLNITACHRSDAPLAAAAPAARVEIAVTADGFVPSQARVKVGQPVTLVVTRNVERTCATDIVIKDYGINQPLPLEKPVTIAFTPTKPGPIHYACAMNMVAGDLVAE